MRRMIVIFALFFLILPFTSAGAGIVWEADYYQFRYAVDENGGIFFYAPAQYFNSNKDTSAHYYDPTQGLDAAYDAVAAGNLVEFSSVSGEIRMNAMAQGPDQGISPPDGLQVQAFTDVVPSGLDASHGVQIRQQVISWISRRFAVDSDGTYTFDANLDGLVNFDTFDNGSTHHAFYSLVGSVSLEQIVIVGGAIVNIGTVAGFPMSLDEAIRNQSLEAQLAVRNDQQQDLTYQLKIALTLQTDVSNLDLQSGTVAGTLAGSFQLAAADAPFVLGVTVSEGGGTNSASVEELITKYYRDILDRAPDPSADVWKAEIERIAALDIDIKEGFIALAKFFFNSEEYSAQNKNNEQFVTDLYQTFFNRAPDPAGADFWVDLLNQGLSRNVVLNYFVYGEEFTAYMAAIFGSNAGLPECNLVNDFYRGLQGRLPDSAGVNGWVGLMRDAMAAGEQAVKDLSYQIALGFLQSAEYTSKNKSDREFLEDLYNGILRRGADSAEFDGWIALIQDGMSREEVLQAFTDSPEFQQRVQGIIEGGP